MKGMIHRAKKVRKTGRSRERAARERRDVRADGSNDAVATGRYPGAGATTRDPGGSALLACASPDTASRLQAPDGMPGGGDDAERLAREADSDGDHPPHSPLDDDRHGRGGADA